MTGQNPAGHGMTSPAAHLADVRFAPIASENTVLHIRNDQRQVGNAAGSVPADSGQDPLGRRLLDRALRQVAPGAGTTFSAATWIRCGHSALARPWTGDRFIITGGIGAAELDRLHTRSAVFAYVERLLERMRPHAQRFILAASCNTPITAGRNQLKWFAEAWQQHSGL